MFSEWQANCFLRRTLHIWISGWGISETQKNTFKVLILSLFNDLHSGVTAMDSVIPNALYINKGKQLPLHH